MENLNITNPEIPETPEDKLELLNQCLSVIAMGGTVEGVTPAHVTRDGIVHLIRARRSTDIIESGL